MTYNDSKAQDEEDLIVYNFFKKTEKPGFVGRLLDIGANDGVALSNSYALIKLGWQADLVEPSPKAYEKLTKLYELNSNVKLHKIAIGNTNGEVDFYETKGLIDPIESIKDNVALTSSLHENWGIDPDKIKVNCVTFNNFLGQVENKHWDFITIDTEGYDYDIFRQINMVKLNCKCICLEYKEYNKDQILELAFARRLHLYNDTGFNLIFVR
jgi:FkbM family methyltransferase